MIRGGREPQITATLEFTGKSQTFIHNNVPNQLLLKKTFDTWAIEISHSGKDRDGGGRNPFILAVRL